MSFVDAKEFDTRIKRNDGRCRERMIKMSFVDAKEFDTRIKRHDGFWAGKNSLISVTAPISNGDSIDIWHADERRNAEDKWRYFTDPELIHESNVAAFSNTYFAGDALPITHFNLGATGYAGFLKGAEYELRDSLWMHKIIDEISEFNAVFDEDSMLYKAEMNILDFYEKGFSPSYLVGNPDNAGVIDVLSLLRGNEFMVDLCTEEEEVLRVLKQIEEVWELVIERTLTKLERINKGRTCVGWLHTTAPGRLAQMQCDVSVMISPDMFERFCMPELERQCSLLEHTLYHFDGMEQVRHLDCLLSLDRLETIQWTCVAGQPSPLEFLDVLKRIQRAGKRILILCKQDEARTLAAELDNGPILLHVDVDSVEEADKLAEDISHIF